MSDPDSEYTDHEQLLNFRRARQSVLWNWLVNIGEMDTKELPVVIIYHSPVNVPVNVEPDSTDEGVQS